MFNLLHMLQFFIPAISFSANTQSFQAESLASEMSNLNVHGHQAYLLDQDYSCGTNANATYFPDDLTLVIWGTGEMEKYFASSKKPWDSIISNIQTIIICDGITSIGDYAFIKHKNLIDVEISDSVILIGLHAFMECSKLTSIVIGPNIQSIRLDPFALCPMENITLLPGNSNFISQDNILYDSQQTRLIVYSAMKEETEFTIPDTVTTIDQYSFSLCFNLQTVIINDNINDIATFAFYQCNSLQKTIIGRNVTKVGIKCFQQCTSLTTAKFLSDYTELDNGAFYRCTMLSTIVLPANITKISDHTFYSCSSLKSIIIPNGVKSIGTEAFSNCGIQSIYIPDSVNW